MIKKVVIVSFFLFLIAACSSSKKKVYSASKKTYRKKVNYPKKINLTSDPKIADKIIWSAVAYKGVPYKYGGDTRQGMDCSGLVYRAFKERNLDIPRTSNTMYSRGFSISLNEVKRGDLLFFKTTTKNRNRVNHVGLVTSSKNNVIKFIHSTTSRGVILSSLNSRYWRKHFVKAKRVL